MDAGAFQLRRFFMDFSQAWDLAIARPICVELAIHGCAKMALQEVLAEMPFPVRYIQVDGGSKFMGEFELAFLDAGIPLIVLPPFP